MRAWVVGEVRNLDSRSSFPLGLSLQCESNVNKPSASSEADLVPSIMGVRIDPLQKNTTQLGR